MKRRDSLPQEPYWETLFDVALILDSLGIASEFRYLAEFTCGYGTFSIPIAQRIGRTFEQTISRIRRFLS